MKPTLLISVLLAFTSLHALGEQDINAPKLSYTAVEEPLKLPLGMNFGPVSGVALNSKSHLFVFHRAANSLMEFDARGRFVKTIGEGFFKRAHSVRVDSEDNIWTTDVETHLVLKFNPRGKIELVLGKVMKKGEWDKRYNFPLFNKPTDIAFGNNGEVFVSDGYGNSRVVKFDREGNFIKAWGKAGDAEGEFDTPHSIATDRQGRVYVADRENRRIQVFDADGNLQTVWTHFGMPSGLFVTKDDELFVCDPRRNRILKADLDGNIQGQYGEPGKALGQMGLAHLLAVDDEKSIYVAEVNNWRMQKFLKLKRQ